MSGPLSEQRFYTVLDERRTEWQQEYRLLHERISNMKDELMHEFKTMREDQEKRWKWTFVGGGAVAMFVVMGGASSLAIFFQ
jgi:aspartate/tyrosine/aromatic aminotransferase